MDAMQQDQIYAQLTEVFRDVLDNDTLELRPDLTADEVEDWDSFNHINLIVATEQRFGIKFQTAELEGMQNVGHLVALIEKKLQAAGR